MRNAGLEIASSILTWSARSPLTKTLDRFSRLKLLGLQGADTFSLALLRTLGVITPSHVGIELPGFAHQARTIALAHSQRGGKGLIGFGQW